MNKSELVDAVAQQQQSPKRTVAEAIDALFQSMTDALQRGEKIQITGFCSLGVRERKARKGRNPQTGEEIDLPAQRGVVLKGSAVFLERLVPDSLPQPESAQQRSWLSMVKESCDAPAESPLQGRAAAPGAGVEVGGTAEFGENDEDEECEVEFEDDEDLGRRVHPRAAVEIPVEYFLADKFITDYTHNIAQGGLFVRSAQQLEPGTELVFKLSVPPLMEPLSVHGQVAWTRSEAQARQEGTDPGMGIKFVYSSEEERAKIQRTVRRLIREQRADSGRADRHRENGPRESGEDAAPRRAHARLPIELKVEYETFDLFVNEYTRNISRGGVFVESKHLLDPGTEFIFKLHVPELIEPLSIYGRVAWTRNEESAGSARPGMGIRFVYSSDEERVRIERTIDALWKRHRQAHC